MDGVNPCAPINPYGASKWMVERVLADYRTAYGFGSFALRYFNAAGADPAGGIGELRGDVPHPARHDGAAGHLPDSAVFGDDYETPDGTAIPPPTCDAELPTRLFGSGHDHPHRLSLAQESPPAEDGWAPLRLRPVDQSGLICTLRNLTTPEPY
jgi:hypothetical protein